MSSPTGPERIEPTGRFGKREALVDAAMSEFSARSFDAASLNTILRTAEVGKGTFYYHFGSKEALYLAVVDHLAERKLAFLKTRAAEPAEGEDFLALLHRQGRLSAEFNLSDPRIPGLSARIAHEPNQSVREQALARTGGRAEDYLQPLVRNAVAAGELRSDLPEEFIVRLLGFLFANFASLFQSHPEGETPRSQGAPHQSAGPGSGAAPVDNVLEAFDYYMDFIRNGLARR
jgi:AcrR family transcriptional regulator